MGLVKLVREISKKGVKSLGDTVFGYQVLDEEKRKGFYREVVDLCLPEDLEKDHTWARLMKKPGGIYNEWGTVEMLKAAREVRRWQRRHLLQGYVNPITHKREIVEGRRWEWIQEWVMAALGREYVRDGVVRPYPIRDLLLRMWDELETSRQGWWKGLSSQERQARCFFRTFKLPIDAMDQLTEEQKKYWAKLEPSKKELYVELGGKGTIMGGEPSAPRWWGMIEHVRVGDRWQWQLSKRGITYIMMEEPLRLRVAIRHAGSVKGYFGDPLWFGQALIYERWDPMEVSIRERVLDYARKVVNKDVKVAEIVEPVILMPEEVFGKDLPNEIFDDEEEEEDENE